MVIFLAQQCPHQYTSEYISVLFSSPNNNVFHRLAIGPFVQQTQQQHKVGPSRPQQHKVGPSRPQQHTVGPSRPQQRTEDSASAQ